MCYTLGAPAIHVTPSRRTHWHFTRDFTREMLPEPSKIAKSTVETQKFYDFRRKMSSYDLQTRRDGPAAEFLNRQNALGAVPDRKKCKKVAIFFGFR